MLRGAAFAGLLAVLLVGGCATAPPAPKTFTGTAGAVKWEVVDIGQVVANDDRGARWTYTVVLTNTGNTSVELEQVQRGSRSANLEISSTRTAPFGRRLAPGAETRASFVDIWEFTRSTAAGFGGASGLGTLTVERRFLGKDELGAAVTVPVIVHLDRGVGKRSARRPSASRPPVKDVAAGDLARLSGSWQGYYRERDAVYNVPLRIEVSTNGSFEAFENDPVTNRFQGWLNIRDGRVTWLQSGDSGTAILHEDRERRLLTGSFGGFRDGSRFDAELWLEAGPVTASISPVPAAGTPAAPAPPARRAGLPPAVQTAFEAYKSDWSLRIFKAFAMDPTSGAWGRSWSHPTAAVAMERALSECRKRGTACEVYAVGDTVLAEVPAERRAAILLGGARLIFEGSLTMEYEGRVETGPATFFLHRPAEEITGTWVSEEPQTSGVITEGASDTNQATVKMTQSNPCHLEFTGTVAISDDGRTLEAAYTGPRCDGVPQKATFRGTRQ
jgi:hypothetical protein